MTTPKHRNEWQPTAAVTRVAVVVALILGFASTADAQEESGARRKAGPVATVIGASGVIGGSGAAKPAAKVKRSGNDKITINFENVELPVFVKFISEVTGRNFVFTEKVSGTVSIISPTPVDASEAYAVFLSVLSARGLTTIDDGIVTRVIPIKEASAGGGGPVSQFPSSGFSTRLIPLAYVEVEAIAAVLNTLLTKEGSLAAYPATNTLIASDISTNLERLSSIVASLDVPGHEETVEVIRLEFADATELGDEIVEILSGGRDRRSDKDKSAARLGFKIVPDTRTNSLVVIATPLELRKIRSLAQELDSALEAGDQRIQVYYARHANAEDLVDVVSGMLGQRRRGSGRADPKAAAGPNAGLGEEFSITADPATNAVIINSSPGDYRTILDLLEKLDLARPQVFIEAILVEATVDDTAALGFDFQGGGGVGDGAGLVRANLSNLNAAFLNPASLSGLILAATSDKTIELPDGTEVPANVLLFQALDRTTEINVLSAPTLLTLDNQEAEITVGENIPFVTGRAADLATIENVFTTVERQDVGIKLRVKPQVTEGNVVILEVEEEVSAVVNNSALDQQQALVVGPSTTVRKASTTVSVGDGRTVVIGGLISDAIGSGVSKVPVLGDIPWLGRLFRYESETEKRVNLIIFLTPHIIRSVEHLDTVTEKRKDGYRKASGALDKILPGDPEVPVDEIRAAPTDGTQDALPVPVPMVEPAEAVEPILVPSASTPGGAAAVQASTPPSRQPPSALKAPRALPPRPVPRFERSPQAAPESQPPPPTPPPQASVSWLPFTAGVDGNAANFRQAASEPAAPRSTTAVLYPMQGSAPVAQPAAYTPPPSAAVAPSAASTSAPPPYRVLAAPARPMAVPAPPTPRTPAPVVTPVAAPVAPPVPESVSLQALAAEAVTPATVAPRAPRRSAAQIRANSIIPGVTPPKTQPDSGSAQAASAQASAPVVTVVTTSPRVVPEGARDAVVLPLEAIGMAAFAASNDPSTAPVEIVVDSAAARPSVPPVLTLPAEDRPSSATAGWRPLSYDAAFERMEETRANLATSAGLDSASSDDAATGVRPEDGSVSAAAPPPDAATFPAWDSTGSTP